MNPSKAATDLPTIDVRKHYVRLLVTWVVTLLGLYAFQQYFS
jgi:hypothetical protein